MSVAELPGALEVRVPATSANVGVGFDCLGIALTLSNGFAFAPAETFSVTGCDERFQGDDNLVWTSYRATLASLGLEGAPFSLAIDTRVPLSGGLGSSSTCIVAGVVCALAAAGEGALGEEGIDAREALRHALAIEGHPDNVAPAIMGGLVSAFTTEEGELETVETAVDERWRFCVLAPSYEVRTEDARRVLPKDVPRETAIWQMARCLVLPRALETGDGELLRHALQDRLHEPYRRRLIPDYDEARRSSEDAGAEGFWISGSGSAMVAACLGDGAAGRVMAAWREAFPGFLAYRLEADNVGTVYRLP